MATREEYNERLTNLVEKVTGSFKSKTDGIWVKVLMGRLNKTYANPEMAVCLEHLQAAVADGQYSWVDKNGKTWVPIRLQVWAGTKKDEATTPIEEKPPAVNDDPNDLIPF